MSTTLDGLLGLRIEIAQQPQLFERVVRKGLRLVDIEDDGAVAGNICVSASQLYGPEAA